MGWESNVIFAFWPLLQGQTTVAKLKNAYNSLVPANRVLVYETNL